MAKIIDGLCVGATVVLLAVSVMDTSAINNSATWIDVLHITSFSFLFGVQLWTVLIAGMVMYRTLPRHMFGLAQSALFPAYFGICVVTSFVTLTALLLRYPYEQWSHEYRNQVITIGVVAVLSLFQRVYLVPVNIQIMNKMFVLEKEAGAGYDVGAVHSEELNMNDNYRKLKKQFGKYHGISNLCGLLVLAPTLYHAYYIAQKLNI